MTRMGLSGTILVALAVIVGLLFGLVDSGLGVIAAAVPGTPALILIIVALSSEGDLSNRMKGIRGEEQVASELSHLSDEFMLLNDVMLPGAHGNIDHIVIGPTGIFVVETKNYSGKFVSYGDSWFFQGYRRKYPSFSVSVQAKNNATSLGNLLHNSGFTVRVSPIIVFTNPYIRLWIHQQTVPVLKSGTVCNFLLAQRPSFQMGPAYLEKIAARVISSNQMPRNPLEH